eukprot:g2051.t1
MGFNNWYTPWSLGKPFTEEQIKRVAEALVSTGLREQGYVYVNLDCGYSSGYRNKTTGQVEADKKRFPSGLKALSSFLHAKKLLFGIYTSGHQCCSPKDGDDGILGHEVQDVDHFAEMGIDFIKNDDCGSTNASFLKTRDAIRKNARPMVHSIHTSYTHGHKIGYPPQQASSVVQASLWRTAGDIGVGNWAAIMDRALQNNGYASVVGNGGLTDAEGRSHMSLWCLMKSPLLIGCDLASASKETLATLGNSEAIAVNQDKLAVQGTLRQEVHGHHQIWAGQLAFGCYAALAINTGTSSSIDVELRWSMLNGSNITSSTPLR